MPIAKGSARSSALLERRLGLVTRGRRGAPLALVIALAAMLDGCAAATLDVVSPVPVPIRSATLTIVDATHDMSTEDLKTFSGYIKAGLVAAGIEVVPPSDLSSHAAVRVVGMVIEWDPGLRPMRFVSRGFGTGRLNSTWEVEDSYSDTLARCRIEGSVSTGTFGGSFVNVQQDAGKALARFLRGGIS